LNDIVHGKFANLGDFHLSLCHACW